jgi:hypothetical protein
VTAVAVRVDGAPAYSLVFDAADLVARSRAVPVAVRLSVKSSTVDDVARGVMTGSAAAMSGLVAIDGEPSVLCRLAKLSAGPRFRAYLGCAAVPHGTGPDLVAVLGAPNDDAGRLSRVAMDRCAAAVDLCRRSPGTELVLCGGFGAHFNTTDVPHWRHCAAWLAGRPGYQPRIAGGVESRHTYEDVLLLRELVRSLRPRRVTVVTSRYHADRAGFVLDLVLPGATLVAVPDDALSVAERDRLYRHEAGALACTVAAALVFGVDRLPAHGTPGDAAAHVRGAC